MCPSDNCIIKHYDAKTSANFTLLKKKPVFPKKFTKPRADAAVGENLTQSNHGKHKQGGLALHSAGPPCLQGGHRRFMELLCQLGVDGRKLSFSVRF